MSVLNRVFWHPTTFKTSKLHFEVVILTSNCFYHVHYVQKLLETFVCVNLCHSPSVEKCEWFLETTENIILVSGSKNDTGIITKTGIRWQNPYFSANHAPSYPWRTFFKTKTRYIFLRHFQLSRIPDLPHPNRCFFGRFRPVRVNEQRYLTNDTRFWKLKSRQTKLAQTKYVYSFLHMPISPVKSLNLGLRFASFFLTTLIYLHDSVRAISCNLK